MTLFSFIANINWSVGPEIIDLGFLSLRWYGLLFALSFIVGYKIMLKIFLNEGKSEKSLESLTMFMIFGTIIGARLGHTLFYDPVYYLSNPIEILKVWQGGLASHGAALGILIFLYLFVKKNKNFTYLWIVDRIVIVVALAGFFIRLGNFFNSEILGQPTDLPWAVIFTNVDGFPRHPSQLYEAFSYLIIFFYLFRFYKAKIATLKPGHLLARFLILVFSTRFMVEFTKMNQVDFESDMVLNMGQILSIPFVLIGIYLLFRKSE